jgi:hypothetical protein
MGWADVVLHHRGRHASAPHRRHDQPADVELLAVARLYVLGVTLNIWVLVGILTAAFAVQFWLGEPPCPLCVMQRIAFMLVGLGLLHTLLRAHRRPNFSLDRSRPGHGHYRRLGRSSGCESADSAAYPAWRSGLRLAYVRPTSLYVVSHRVRLSDRGERRLSHCVPMA